MLKGKKPEPDTQLRDWAWFILFWLAIGAAILANDIQQGTITLKGLLQ